MRRALLCRDDARVDGAEYVGARRRVIFIAVAGHVAGDARARGDGEARRTGTDQRRAASGERRLIPSV
jgi:hypothetical protein